MRELPKFVSQILAWSLLLASSANAGTDPAAVDTNTGTNFNRYAYANNSPYKFTDPDGRNPKGCGDGTCNGVMLSGPLDYRKDVRGRLEEIRSADPENAQRLDTLEGSKFAHRIVPLSREPATEGRAANRANAGPEANGEIRADGTAGPGVGTVTVYDPNKSVSGGVKGSGTPAGILAHELVGHGFDKDQGTNDTSKNPATGERRSEESGRAAERRHIEPETVE